MSQKETQFSFEIPWFQTKKLKGETDLHTILPSLMQGSYCALKTIHAG